MINRKVIQKDNAIILSTGVDLGVQVIALLTGDKLGTSKEDAAKIISAEMNNEIVNRRDYNAK